VVDFCYKKFGAEIAADGYKKTGVIYMKA